MVLPEEVGPERAMRRGGGEGGEEVVGMRNGFGGEGCGGGMFQGLGGWGF